VVVFTQAQLLIVELLRFTDGLHDLSQAFSHERKVALDQEDALKVGLESSKHGIANSLTSRHYFKYLDVVIDLFACSFCKLEQI